MGIDRIAGRPAGAPVPETGQAAQVGPAERAFEGAKPSAASTAAAATGPAGPLEALRAGHIDLDGYIQHKVSEATAHLGALPAPELEAIRQALRDRMASDPLLVELAQTATGRPPTPPSDE